VHDAAVSARLPASLLASRWVRAPLLVTAVLLLLLIVCDRTVHAGTPPGPETDSVAASAWAVRQSELCTAAVRQAEEHFHLPPALLLSVAKAESGRPITSASDIRPWPWTIDADGAGIFVDSKAAAIAWMRALSAGHSFLDVGCMQVDLRYHPNAFRSLEEAFDPVANANYAARLLTDLYQGEAAASWDVAVGLYHSHTALRAAEYRDRVAIMGTDLLHGTLKGVPLYVRAMRAGTLRLPLTGGRLTLINVHRQPANRSRHPYSACQIERILGPYLNGGMRAAACLTVAR
jgi:Transglycosylase SLT domain